MRQEAVSHGYFKYQYKDWKSEHLKIQILTVGDLFKGAKIDYPAIILDRTFKKAPKAKREKQNWLDVVVD